LLLYWSDQMLTESLFISLFVLSIALTWKAIHDQRPLTLIVTGAVIGLSYLTRIVGILGLPLAMLWMVLHRPLALGINRIPIHLIWIVLGFGIVTLPVWIANQASLGTWSITGSYGSVEAYLSQPLGTPENQGISLFDKMTTHLFQYLKLALFVFPVLFFLVYLGLKSNGWRKFLSSPKFMLLLWISCYLLVYLFFPVRITTDEYLRYLAPLLPLFYMIAAHGLVLAGEKLPMALRKRHLHYATLGIVVVTSLLLEAVQIRSHGLPFAEIGLWRQGKVRDVYKEMGNKIKKNLPPIPRIMSRKPYVAYHADGIWFPVSGGTYEEIIESAKQRDVEYILVDSLMDPTLVPQLGFLLALPSNLKDLKLLAFLKEPHRDQARLAIYEVAKDVVPAGVPVYSKEEQNYIDRARVYQAQSQMNQAIQEYRKALALNPKNFVTHYNLAVLYLAQGELDLAIASFQEALKIEPDFWESHYNLGIAYYDLGFTEQAIAHYKRARDLKPDEADVHFNLALAYARAEKFDLATVEYEETLRLNPKNISAHNNLGNAYRNLGQLDRAVVEFEEALKLNPRDVLANYNVATTKDLMGVGKDIVPYYEAVVRLAGQDPEYRYFAQHAQRRLNQLHTVP
ncbi:MAG: tetratricopeptide repeat protein, partial [Nitrospira sp.]|nr:tetratricopeptide repeat protein [Nitrospira sp.]